MKVAEALEGRLFFI